jgi:hypothetical protein
MSRRAAAAVAPLLLACVACGQLWLAHARALTPWCGGGFGMFSTVDGWGARHLHAWLRGDGWRREVEVPRELAELERRALALPDARRLRALARELAARDGGNLGEPRAVEILVFTRRFEPAELTPEGVLLASFETPID